MYCTLLSKLFLHVQGILNGTGMGILSVMGMGILNGMGMRILNGMGMRILNGMGMRILNDIELHSLPYLFISFSSPWSCSATVTECKANLPSLTHQEMDDLVMTEDMEPCVVMVDVGLGRITEDFVLPGTAGKNRNTRDLSEWRGVIVI